MDYGEEPGNFDIIIVNDDLETAYTELRDFIMPEIEKLQARQPKPKGAETGRLQCNVW